MEAKNWNELQQEYIEFFARGLRTEDDEKISRDEWGKRHDTNPATLWKWQQLPGFKQAVFDLAVQSFLPRIPDLLLAQVAKATGQTLKDKKGKDIKGGDTQAFMALMRQFELLKADKQESKQEVEHSGSVKVEGLDDAELEAKLEQIISQRQA